MVGIEVLLEMVMKKFFSIVVLLFSCSGCVSYKYMSNEQECSLVIRSWWRELQLAGVHVNKDCSLYGGGSGMTYNKEAMTSIKAIVDKIP